MKPLSAYSSFGILLSLLLITSCSGFKKPGKEVTGPFSSSRYQTNSRYFRGIGSGTSMDLNTSKSKAMITAKQRLASSVNTTMRTVADRYVKENSTLNASDFMSKYEEFNREVTNTMLADIRVIGERTFKLPNNQYETHIALEIRKRSMYNHLRRQARLMKQWNEAERAAMEDLIDRLLAELKD